MRYVGEIATSDAYKIGLYRWNGKYIIKIETSLYEQTFKVSEMDFVGTEDDVRALFADETFLKSILQRFQQMHQDFQEVMLRFDCI